LPVPILDDQGVLGDLWLVSNGERIFAEQDIRLVQQVANQCAIALRQARLYQAAQAQVEALESSIASKTTFSAPSLTNCERRWQTSKWQRRC
jgi:GAF domain-containing protein